MASVTSGSSVISSDLLPVAAWPSGGTFSQAHPVAALSVETLRETKEPLVGANVVLPGTTIGASADLNGFIEIQNIPEGKQTIIFSYIGYQDRSEIFNFPLTQSEPLDILLHAEA